MRSSMRRAAWASLILSLALSSLTRGTARAQGDSTHYQTLQLGERSRGLAAAYTGYAGDGAAIWFNPAGLPLLEARLLQGSLSLVQIRRTDVEGAIVSDGPDGEGGEDQVSDFSFRTRPALPGFAVASFAVGKEQEKLGGRKPVQFAISAFVLYNFTTGGDINFQDELGRTNSLQFYQSDRASYFALGVGHRPVRNFSWGVTLLARNRTIEHVETAALAVGGTQDPTQGSPCPSSPTIPFCILDANQINRNTVFRMNSWDLSVRIGLLNLIGKRWRVGIMFQPPGFRVGGKSNLRFELSDIRSSNNPANPDLSDSVFAEIERDSRSPIPWELRFGVAYVISSKTVVAADLQLVGPVPGGSIAPNVPQLEGRANSSGILLADSTKRDFTWNISIGTEVEFANFLFARFGFLTDNSSAPDASGTESFIRPAQVDRLGFSASLGGYKNARGLSGGVSMLFGRGTGNGLDFRQEAFRNDSNFTRVPVKERIFIISIGGDIGQTAGALKERMGSRSQEQDVEAELASEIKEKEKEVTEEVDPELRAAEEAAVETRKQALEAEQRAQEAIQRVEEADREVERLKARSSEKDNQDSEDERATEEATE